MSDDNLIQTVNTYNAIADHYASQMDAYTPEADRKLFLTYLKPGSKILDVGCAAGRDSIYFSQFGHKTVGVDLSEKLLAIARKKAPNLTFLHDDICKKLFPNGSFNAVWACAVLLHQSRQEVPGILRNFYQALVDDGVLFVRVKEGRGEGDVVEELSKDQSRHFTYFELDELEGLIRGAGFVIEKAYRSNEKDIDPTLRDLWWATVIAKKKASHSL